MLSVYSDGVVSWDNFLPRVNAEIHKLIEASGKVTLDQKLIPTYFMDLPIRNCVAKIEAKDNGQISPTRI